MFVSASMREAVRLPVFCTGRIKDPLQAERILREGLADMVDVVRGQICDPQFTRKARAGRTEAIRLCISCNQYCIGRMGLNLSLGCIQTPATGNEQRFPRPLPLAQARHMPTLMVIGGGPAGMQAAKVAAQHGYRVKLFEQQQELGGQINLLTRVPGRVEFGDAARNLQRELLAGDVEIQLGIEVTAEMVMRAQPQAVIIATGSRPAALALPGADLPHAASTWQVLQGEKEARPGEFMLVYDQVGFHQATSVAELLAERGARVEVVTPQFYVGGDLGLTLDLELWYRRVLARGVRLTANYFLASLGERSATIINNYTGQARRLEQIALAVIVAPQAAQDTLYHQLKGRVPQLQRVGDCVAPRRVEHAILDGERAARALAIHNT